MPPPTRHGFCDEHDAVTIRARHAQNPPTGGGALDNPFLVVGLQAGNSVHVQFGAENSPSVTGAMDTPYRTPYSRSGSSLHTGRRSGALLPNPRAQPYLSSIGSVRRSQFSAKYGITPPLARGRADLDVVSASSSSSASPALRRIDSDVTKSHDRGNHHNTASGKFKRFNVDDVHSGPQAVSGLAYATLNASSPSFGSTTQDSSPCPLRLNPVDAVMGLTRTSTTSTFVFPDGPASHTLASSVMERESDGRASDDELEEFSETFFSSDIEINKRPRCVAYGMMYALSPNSPADDASGSTSPVNPGPIGPTVVTRQAARAMAGLPVQSVPWYSRAADNCYTSNSMVQTLLPANVTPVSVFNGRRLGHLFFSRASIRFFSPRDPRPSSFDLLMEMFSVTAEGVLAQRFGDVFAQCIDCKAYVYADAQESHDCDELGVLKESPNDKHMSPFRVREFLFERGGGLSQRQLQDLLVVCRDCDRALCDQFKSGHVCNPL